VLSADLFGSLATQLGFGGVTGFIVGYAVKKILKFLVVLIGIFFVALQYLAYQGFITINYEKFEQAFRGLSFGATIGVEPLPAFITANVPFLGSFVAGLAIGMAKG